MTPRRSGRCARSARRAAATTLLAATLPLLAAACAPRAGGGPPTGPATAPAADPLYVAMLTTRQTRLDGTNPPVGVFRSMDGGATWEHLGWAQGKAFAVIASPGGDTLLVAQGNGVHRSVDAGETWRVLTGWQVTEVQDVALEGARIYAGTPYGVFVSADAGERWSARSEGLATPDATFVSTVRADRVRAERVLIGTEAGVFVSDDGGARWRPLPLEGPVRALRQSPHDPARWAAALQDRGAAVSEDGGATWRYAGGLPTGTTFYTVEWDPHEPDVLWGGGWRTGVLRSSDGGATWEVRGELPEPSVHGLAVPRGAPGVVFAGTLGEELFRSVDGGRRWQGVAPEVFGGGQIWDVYAGGGR